MKTCIKGALLGLAQFLSAENFIKMFKNAFYFIVKAFFVLKILKFVSRLFVHAEERLD